jgi:hypothetical protein
MYLSYIVGVIFCPLTGKLTNQIGTDATVALGAVASDFNTESLVPPRIARSSTYHNVRWITSYPFEVSSKPVPTGHDFHCYFFDQKPKFTHKNYTIKR